MTSSKKSVKILLTAYFSRHWPRYVLGISMVFASTYFAASIPRLIGAAVDVLGLDGGGAEIGRAALNIGVAAFLAFAIRFLWRYLVFGATRGAETFVRVKLFEHLESQAADFYVRFNTGDIITRAISDITAIRRMFGFGFVAALDAGTIIIVAAINMHQSAGLAMMLAAVIPVPVLTFFVSKIRKSLRRRQYEIREASSNLAAKVQENLNGIRVIKTYAQEHSEAENVALLSRARWDTEMRMVKLSATITPLIQVAFALVFAVFIIVGSRMVGDGTMSLGDFTAFNGYIVLMAAPVSQMGRVIELWQTGLSSIMRLDEIFTAKPAVDDRYAEEDIRVTEGRIEFKNLTFAYPPPADNPGLTPVNVLRGISLTINPGETIAITGPVGSGKTSLAAVLLRQWRAPQGMVEVDGNDINSIPIKNLRGAIGYVPQDNFLFSDSIMNNIRFYHEGVTDEDVYAAAKAVSIHDNIDMFPDKYDTVVGERGMTLSGGQKQRVSIARALVRKPKILLLDDCLSAVDSETEHAIIQGLKGYMTGSTGIIITHRAAAAQLADRIMVLAEDGSVSELGTYRELMDKRGDFYNLVMLQTGEAGGESA